MYPANIVLPMKSELTEAGFEDLSTPELVEGTLSAQEGTVFMVINSVCGCAAANARPGAKLALNMSDKKPHKNVTVFAGFDIGAVAKARTYTQPYPPSSPSMALFKDGKLVYFMERHQIEGVSAQSIARQLIAVFDEHC